MIVVDSALKAGDLANLSISNVPEKNGKKTAPVEFRVIDLNGGNIRLRSISGDYNLFLTPEQISSFFGTLNKLKQT
jgi:hypothetical protein